MLGQGGNEIGPSIVAGLRVLGAGGTQPHYELHCRIQRQSLAEEASEPLGFFFLTCVVCSFYNVAFSVFFDSFRLVDCSDR